MPDVEPDAPIVDEGFVPPPTPPPFDPGPQPVYSLEPPEQAPTPELEEPAPPETLNAPEAPRYTVVTADDDDDNLDAGHVVLEDAWTVAFPADGGTPRLIPNARVKYVEDRLLEPPTTTPET